MALLGGLAGDAEGFADLRPRAGLIPGLLHEMVEELVTQRLDLILDGGGRRHPVERPVGLLHCGDELVEVHAVNLALTLAGCQF